MDSILTISNSSTEDLCRFFPSLEEKVRVMPLGGEHLRRLSTEQVHTGQPELQGELHESVRGQDFCLFVGGRYAYKNFACVVEALSLPTWPSDLRLVVVGPPFDGAERAFIKAMAADKKIVHVGKVNDDVLSVYYRSAKCFIFPSLIEGFGIPILEAQTFGVVPVISDTPVFHEVAGEGAIFFNPSSPNELANAVKSVLVLEIRTRTIQAAEKNLSRFSWDRAASITMQCYEDLWARNGSNHGNSVAFGTS
ncbi:MAG: glycosyltransferase family 1 protein [Planctomycetota bacterium]|nr:glycosyltransferase family 1 protein [Planctomycetota bacterium]